MDITVFGQSIARVKVYETRLLNSSKLEGMVEARDFSEVIRMLQDSPYSSYLNMPSYEEGLRASLEDMYREMRRIVPVSEVVDVLAARYDAHNIKCLIKGKFSGINTDRLLINAGTVEIGQLKSAFRDDDYRELPETLQDSIKEALEAYKKTEDPQGIDLIIDRGIFKFMFEIAKSSGLDYLTRLVRLMIDISNIRSFIRIKSQDRGIEFLTRSLIEGGNLAQDIFTINLVSSMDSFLRKISFTEHDKWVIQGVEEYQRTGDLGRVERAADNFIIDHIGASKLISFGPEPIIAYMLARENEIKALRIILTGKKNEVHPESIRERLRDVYV